MYVNLDHVKEVAEAYRAEKLKASLIMRLQDFKHNNSQGLKLDNFYRSYRDEILKGIGSLPLDALRVVDTRLNNVVKQLEEMRAPLPAKGPVPVERIRAMHQVTKGLQEMLYVVKTRPPVKHGMKLEDRARQYVTGIEFNADEIAGFVQKDAEGYRETRRAELTLVSFKNYQEMVKVEDEIAAKYKLGIDFFAALYEASATDELEKLGSKRMDACDRSASISRAATILRSRIDHTSVEKDRLRRETDAFIRSMQQQSRQLMLMPKP